MSEKPRPNDAVYLEILRRMTPEQRAKKAFELTEFSRKVFLTGLRQRYPEKSDDEIRALYLERLALCHNQTS